MVAEALFGPRKAAVVFIFITVVLDMLALGIVIPVLPRLIMSFEHDNAASTAQVLGLFLFIWAAMQFMSSPTIGMLSDRFGRRPLVLLSNAGLACDYVLMALAPSLSWLFLGRAISGMTAASFPIANAYISDVTPPEKRAAYFGMLGAAFGLGFIVGPALGGLLGGIDVRLPFWAAAGLSTLNTLYGLFVLPESLPPEKRSSFTWANANPLGALRLLRTRIPLTWRGLAFLVDSVAHESLASMIVLYCSYRYAWSMPRMGIAMTAIGGCAAVVSIFLTGPAVRRLGENATVFLGLSCGLIGFLLISVAAHGVWFWVAIPILSLWCLSTAGMQALMSRLVEPTQHGQLQGALASMRGIAGMSGPPMYTHLFAFAISTQGLLARPGLPYLVAALFLALSVALSWRALRSSQTLPVISLN